MVFTCAPCKAIGKVPHQWPTSSKKLNHKAKCKSNQVIKNHGFIRPDKVAVHAHALVHLSLSYCHPAFLLSCPLALLLATLLILCSPALKFSRSLDLLLSSCPVVLSTFPPLPAYTSAECGQTWSGHFTGQASQDGRAGDKSCSSCWGTGQNFLVMLRSQILGSLLRQMK